MDSFLNHFNLHSPRSDEVEQIPSINTVVMWDIARSSIPEVIEALGENMPDLREALQRATDSRFDIIPICLLPEEAKEVWHIFEARRAERLKSDASS